MDRLCHIGVAHHIAPIKECHHPRNPFNLTPSSYPEPLNSSTRYTGHPIRASGLLRQGCAHRRCTLTGGKRCEFTVWECSQWRARPSKPYAQRKSIADRR
jgi:hypothetical protein